MLSIVCLALFSTSSFLFSCDEHHSDKIQSLSRYRATHHGTPYTRPSFVTQKKRAEDEQRRQELAGRALKKAAIEKVQTTINQATAVAAVAAPALAKKEEAGDEQDTSSKPLSAIKKEQRFIYDAYTQRRGTPKIISIFCENCDLHIMDYQKDGPGRLLRCYSDRCIDCPISAANRYFNARTVLSAPRLQCQHCTSTIGKPMIYRGYGENRPAFHLNPGAFYIKN